MGAGPFSSDANSTKQTSTQQQVAASGGAGYGGLSDIKKNSGGVFGGGSTGNVSVNKGKGASGDVNVVTYDPAAALAAIASNQALSTQSVSYANVVATDALETLRSLQAGRIVADASGSSSDITGALTNTAGTVTNAIQTSPIKTILIITAIAVGGYLLFKH